MKDVCVILQVDFARQQQTLEAYILPVLVCKIRN